MTKIQNFEFIFIKKKKKYLSTWIIVYYQEFSSYFIVFNNWSGGIAGQFWKLPNIFPKKWAIPIPA